jgi:HD-GYP domain-containing protein (c-di-GMP phosphodiesterase class II)
MPIVDRARGVAKLLSDKNAVMRHSQAQCETSIWLARRIGSREGVIRALEQICERYDGRGAPRGTSGNDLTFAVRVSHVADVAEIAFHRGGVANAVEEVERRAGKQLDPVLAHALVARANELFEPLAGTNAWDAYLACEPEPFATADDDKVDLVARAFGALADLKSVHTVGHSARVARLARGAAESLGLDPIMLERAGHLHDLGRVAVPNSVWDRPGPLDAADWERVRMHSYFTERILRRAGSLSSVASLAAAAHERLDGEGYAKGLDAKVLDPSANVLAAADVLAALGEDRPHRRALDDATAKATLMQMAASGRLSQHAALAVLAAAGTAPPRPMAASTPSQGLTAREIEVVRWIARGKSNREIAELLAISPRTVQNRIAHVYDELGLYSRAGATLWALERGLVG